MLQRDNIPAKPRRFSLIQHPITSDISLRRRYASKYKLNAAIAKGKGLWVALAPQEITHTTPTPQERISYSPSPKSTSRIYFELTASCRHPRHTCTHTAQHANPLQSLIPRSMRACKLTQHPHLEHQKNLLTVLTTSRSSDHYLLLLSSRRWEANITLKSDPPVPSFFSLTDHWRCLHRGISRRKSC